MDMDVMAGTIILAVAAIAGGFGNAIVISQFIKGVARQPEARGTLLIQTILGVALVEVIPIIAVAFGIIKILGIM